MDCESNWNKSVVYLPQSVTISIFWGSKMQQKRRSRRLIVIACYQMEKINPDLFHNYCKRFWVRSSNVEAAN